MPVVIGIDQIERPAVEFETARGTGECHPQLLIQLVEVGEVVAIGQHDLIDGAGPEESPAVLFHGE
jgi:hypothetical protein